MQISVKNAYANNLKNISTNIPIGQISALTGASGSGKSTLLRDIIGAYGYRNYTRIASKTVKDSLIIEDDVQVDKIDYLPNTILIDVKSTISNPISTVSTVSGIHEILRNLFVEYGEMICGKCGAVVTRDLSKIKHFTVDLIVDDKFGEATAYIESRGHIDNIEYFDKHGNYTENEKKKAFATLHFSLKEISERIVKAFNKEYSCSVSVISGNTGETYDFIKEIECPGCYSIGPNLLRSRLSYSTSYEGGGGACRCCRGTGKTTQIKVSHIFRDRTKGILNGASPFITPKGIKYSNVTEKFIAAVYKEFECDVDTPIAEIPSDLENVILKGVTHEISFIDRTGGNKTLIFEGVSSYLDSAYRANKGGSIVADLFDESVCNDCRGTRFDKAIRNFVFCGKTIDSLMEMTLDELGQWCVEIHDMVPEKSNEYINRIIKETSNFNMLSCGHLALSRQSNTLSGGELQRIRICALLNSDINGLCYLLDEPSSGLHYEDIEKLASLLREICNRGNTVIMVEHNKKMLSYCDYIIDMGPFGGEKGGNILFSSPINEIGNYNTETSQILLETGKNTAYEGRTATEAADFLEFDNLTFNNLKNVTVRFPKNSFTAVCGISGSGKSTFVKKAVMATIESNPKSYGFNGIDYLGQASRIVNNHSTVASLIKIGEYIAKLFEKTAKGKIKKNSFLIGSREGKCTCCGGKGHIYSAADELIGICDQCEGFGFAEDVLQISVDGLNIYDFYNMSMGELGDVVKDAKVKEIAKLANKLGVGYLNFARQSKTLSKGELQRVSLIQILMGKENNHLLILDEPSKGLHASDIKNLVYALRDITESGNTLLVVEHSPEMLRNADYLIEFGGTGIEGGYVLFQGKPSDISGTPTAKMLSTFEIHKNEQIDERKKYIIVNDDGNTMEYLPNNLYYESEHRDALLKAVKKSKDDFLSVAIPNNSMFSRLDRNIIESDTPIMMDVDFKEKIKYNISVSDALGIRHLLCKAVAEECSDNIAKYIFDPNSSTGKCLACKGIGKTLGVDRTFFLEGDEMSASCKKFLKNSTDFSKFAKLMKKEGVDLTKEWGIMSTTEQTILFWGADSFYEIDGKFKRWEGIIPYFIQYHNYYPDKKADSLFMKKAEMECPICKGDRIKTKYAKYKCCGLSYRDWMSVPMGELTKRINTDNEALKMIQERLIMVCALGLGDLLLSDELVSLDETSAAKIKLASICFNRIYSMGLVVNNIGALDEDEQVNIKKILSDLAETTTVWVV